MAGFGRPTFVFFFPPEKKYGFPVLYLFFLNGVEFFFLSPFKVLINVISLVSRGFFFFLHIWMLIIYFSKQSHIRME